MARSGRNFRDRDMERKMARIKRGKSFYTNPAPIRMDRPERIERNDRRVDGQKVA